MNVVDREQLPIAIAAPGGEARTVEVGGMALTFYRFARGTDLHDVMRGLPGDACTCPHWAYVLSGRLRIHTASGPREVSAGQAYYVEPGHVPEVLEETELFEVSPAAELHRVFGHVLHRIAEEQERAPTVH